MKAQRPGRVLAGVVPKVAAMVAAAPLRGIGGMGGLGDWGTGRNCNGDKLLAPRVRDVSLPRVLNPEILMRRLLPFSLLGMATSTIAACSYTGVTPRATAEEEVVARA